VSDEDGCRIAETLGRAVCEVVLVFVGSTVLALAWQWVAFPWK
jgi:hypothetical protein